MRSSLAFIVAVVALVVVLATEIWLTATFLPSFPLFAVFLEMTPVMKMAAILIILLAVAGVIGGLMGDAKLGWIAAFLAVVVALLGAAYGEMTVQAALREVGPMGFDVTAPARAESLLLIILGLFAAVLSLGVGHWRRRPAAA